MDGVGLVFNWIFKTIGMSSVGVVCIILFALVGFICGTFKIPDSSAFKVTRLVGGENIDDIILRYIKFRQKKNRIYITKEEEINNG